MSAPLPHEIAGETLKAPRLFYDADGPPPVRPPPQAPGAPPSRPGPPAWASASIARPHAARALGGCTLVVRFLQGAPTATFDLAPLVQPAVQPYWPAPAAAWRALLVDHRLLTRPEVVWTGSLPEGWKAGLAADDAEAVASALTALHRRYLSLTEGRSLDYSLRSLECAECRADRAAKLPPNLPPWQRQMRLSSSIACPHLPAAADALGALSRAHPELTFELLGWIEPAGARPRAEGAPATRFALTGPLMEALLGPWLVGEDKRHAARMTFTGYVGGRYYDWRAAHGNKPAPDRPTLPRAQKSAVALAAAAWGFVDDPESLVHGDARAEAPGLDRAAAPPIEAPAVMPGNVPRRKRARKKR